MTLSLLLILLFPLFLVPAIFLPHNRLFSYLIPAFVSTLVLLSLLMIELFAPGLSFFDRIGSFFEPMFSFLMNKRELMEEEILHLSCFYALGLIYGITYLIAFLLMKRFYIGSSPYVSSPIKKTGKVFEVILLNICTYLILFFFLIEIRRAIPLREGFLAPFFSWIYPIEA